MPMIAKALTDNDVQTVAVDCAGRGGGRTHNAESARQSPADPEPTSGPPGR